MMAEDRKMLRLSMRDKHILTDLVLKEWGEKKVGLKEFAAYAAQTLGFEVNDNLVRGILEAFEIPRVHAPSSPEAAVIEALERRVVTLEKRLEVYFTGGVKS